MVVGRQWVAFWKALIVLYRLVVVPRPNIDLLPIDSTKSTLTIRIWSPSHVNNRHSKFESKSPKRETVIITIRQPLESLFQALSINDINTARPPCGRPRKIHFSYCSTIYDWLTGQRSQKAPALISDVMTVGTSASNNTLLLKRRWTWLVDCRHIQ